MKDPPMMMYYQKNTVQKYKKNKRTLTIQFKNSQL